MKNSNSEDQRLRMSDQDQHHLLSPYCISPHHRQSAFIKSLKQKEKLRNHLQIKQTLKLIGSTNLSKSQINDITVQERLKQQLQKNSPLKQKSNITTQQSMNSSAVNITNEDLQAIYSPKIPPRGPIDKSQRQTVIKTNPRQQPRKEKAVEESYQMEIIPSMPKNSKFKGKKQRNSHVQYHHIPYQSFEDPNQDQLDEILEQQVESKEPNLQSYNNELPNDKAFLTLQSENGGHLVLNTESDTTDYDAGAQGLNKVIEESRVNFNPIESQLKKYLLSSETPIPKTKQQQQQFKPLKPKLLVINTSQSSIQRNPSYSQKRRSIRLYNSLAESQKQGGPDFQRSGSADSFPDHEPTTQLNNDYQTADSLSRRNVEYRKFLLKIKNSRKCGNNGLYQFDGGYSTVGGDSRPRLFYYNQNCSSLSSMKIRKQWGQNQATTLSSAHSTSKDEGPSSDFNLKPLITQIKGAQQQVVQPEENPISILKLFPNDKSETGYDQVESRNGTLTTSKQNGGSLYEHSVRKRSTHSTLAGGVRQWQRRVRISNAATGLTNNQRYVESVGSQKVSEWQFKDFNKDLQSVSQPQLQAQSSLATLPSNARGLESQRRHNDHHQASSYLLQAKLNSKRRKTSNNSVPLPFTTIGQTDVSYIVGHSMQKCNKKQQNQSGSTYHITGLPQLPLESEDGSATHRKSFIPHTSRPNYVVPPQVAHSSDITSDHIQVDQPKVPRVQLQSINGSIPGNRRYRILM